MQEWDLERLSGRLRQAAIQPSAWPDVLDELSRSFDGMGAQFFSCRTLLPSLPASPSLRPWMDEYFADGWKDRSERRPAVQRLQGGQVVVDQDFMTGDGIAKSPMYQTLLRKHGMAWIACVGFRLGEETWGLALHRPVGGAPFAARDKHRLAELAPHLSEAATLACHVNRAHADGVVAGCQGVHRPCVLFDDEGRVLALNERAEELIGTMIGEDGMLRFADGESRSRFEACLRASIGPAPERGAPANCPLRGADGRQLAVQASVLGDPQRFAFIGARAMMLIDHSLSGAGQLGDLQVRYGLTPAESLLAGALCKGASLRQSAANARVTYQTARSTLKQIFVKTRTHRQAELVAKLIGREP